MPQAGQRIPSSTRVEQGGSPNCWCVPKPSLAGESEAASSNGAANVAAVKIAKIRVRLGVSMRRAAGSDRPKTEW